MPRPLTSQGPDPVGFSPQGCLGDTAPHTTDHQGENRLKPLPSSTDRKRDFTLQPLLLHSLTHSTNTSRGLLGACVKCQARGLALG